MGDGLFPKPAKLFIKERMSLWLVFFMLKAGLCLREIGDSFQEWMSCG